MATQRTAHTAELRASGHFHACEREVERIREGLARLAGATATWATVGTLAHLREQLTDLADMLHETGEHAPEARGGR